MNHLRIIVIAAMGGSVLAVACSSDTNVGPGGSSGLSSTSSGGSTSSGSSSGDNTSSSSSSSSGSTGVTLDPSNPCTDSLDAVYGDPGSLTAGTPGKILKCAKDPAWTAEAINKRLPAGVAKVTAGAKVYRVLYQTERGDKDNSPGYSTARVVVPDGVKADSGFVVIASGTRGQAAACAASRIDSNDAVFTLDEAQTMLYAAVAGGKPAMLHDGAGYSNPGKNLPPGYAFTADNGKSMLDGARGMTTLFPTASKKAFLIGHSHGGHIALSALSLADTYGKGIDLAGVVVHAPYWMSQRTNGALLSRDASFASGVNIENSPLTAGIAIWYHYQHAEALDGPGEGLKLFKAEYRTKVKDYFDNYCLFNPTSPQVGGIDPKLKYIADAFEPDLTSAVGVVAAGLGGACQNPTCNKWMDRYKADRPRMNANVAKIPLLINYGGNDMTIPEERMSCGLDHLGLDKKDANAATTCYVPGATHANIVGAQSGYVNSWIDATLTGAAAPACTKIPTLATCAALPPNAD
jgi:pimeloyl-ACP methyl ester carboxylesterase